MAGSTLKIVKLKQKAWNKYKATKCHVEYISYCKCRNNTVKHAKSAFETNLARDIPNLFWKYVRSNTKVWDDVDKLVKEDDTLTCPDL